MKPRLVRFCIPKCTKTWFRVYLPLTKNFAFNATSFWKFVAGRKLKVGLSCKIDSEQQANSTYIQGF